jgi:hypothetical protein
MRGGEVGMSRFGTGWHRFKSCHRRLIGGLNAGYREAPINRRSQCLSHAKSQYYRDQPTAPYSLDRMCSSPHAFFAARASILCFCTYIPWVLR